MLHRFPYLLLSILRILCTALAVLLLLLILRSFWCFDAFIQRTSPSSDAIAAQFHTWHGSFGYYTQFIEQPSLFDDHLPLDQWEYQQTGSDNSSIVSSPRDYHFTFAGIVYHRTPPFNSNSLLSFVIPGYLVIHIPLYLPLCLLAAYPLGHLFFAWKRRRPRPGLCPICHYDLRASKSRCPECGTSIQ